MSRHRLRSGSRRRGLSILEVMIGLTVLGLGIIPLFQLFSTTRGVVGQSRKALHLENVTMQALAEVEALVSSGHFQGLDPAEEEVLQRDDDGVHIKMVVTRVDEWRLYQINVRSETAERYFELAVVCVDPMASVHTWFLPADELPEAFDTTPERDDHAAHH